MQVPRAERATEAGGNDSGVFAAAGCLPQRNESVQEEPGPRRLRGLRAG